MAGSSGLTKSGQLQLLTSEDGCVLLDIDNDRILKLNSVAAEMWTLLSAGHTESQIAGSLSQKYQASEQRVAADVAALARRIAELRIARDSIFTPTPETGNQSSSPHPSFPWYGQASSYKGPKPTRRMVIAAFLGLAIFDAILSLLSLKSMCSCVRLWPVTRSTFASSAAIGQVCDAVQRACVWYPKRTLCLQRSAVTTCLLRAYGISARMMIGIRPMPFLAHAWVEADGSVINDWPRVKKFYRPLLSH
jgi:Transglutaminase-like superfamily/Coenzyme PQQ synthesis protein D (PqqD)